MTIFRYKLLVCVFLAFFFVACASTSIKDLGIYDESVSESELCTLQIAGGLHVNTFDGRRVGSQSPYGEDSLSGWGLGGYAANIWGKNGKATIKIPAGRHELICGYYQGNAQSSEKTNGLTITYDFEAGKIYLLTYIIIRDYGKDSILLQIERQKTWP